MDTKDSVQFRSVAQSCPTLCDPMNRSTPGLPVHHQLPEFNQTHVHRVSDTIQPSHPLSSPFPVQFRSVAQSCPTLCDPMNRSTPDLPVHHHLPEFTQTHVYRVSDTIQPSHPVVPFSSWCSANASICPENQMYEGA